MPCNQCVPCFLKPCGICMHCLRPNGKRIHKLCLRRVCLFSRKLTVPKVSVDNSKCVQKLSKSCKKIKQAKTEIKKAKPSGPILHNPLRGALKRESNDYIIFCKLCLSALLRNIMNFCNLKASQFIAV